MLLCHVRLFCGIRYCTKGRVCDLLKYQHGPLAFSLPVSTACQFLHFVSSESFVCIFNSTGPRMYRRSLASGLIAIFLALPFVDAQSCYLPDGIDRSTINPNSTYEICTPTVAGSQHSMCCDSTAAGGGKCQPSGLCYYSSYNTLFREGCTDPTWQDPSCLKLYVNGTGMWDRMLFEAGHALTKIDINGSVRDNNTIMVATCNSADANIGPFCETAGNEACCAANEGFKIKNGVVEPANTSTESSSLPSSTPASATATTASSSDATSSTGVDATAASSMSRATQVSTKDQADTGTSNSTAAIAGGIIGGLCAGIAITTLVLFLLRRRKRQAATGPAPADHCHEIGPPTNSEKATYSGKWSQRSSSSVMEMAGWHGHEMPTQTERYELEQPRAELPPVQYYR